MLRLSLTLVFATSSFGPLYADEKADPRDEAIKAVAEAVKKKVAASRAAISELREEIDLMKKGAIVAGSPVRKGAKGYWFPSEVSRAKEIANLEKSIAEKTEAIERLPLTFMGTYRPSGALDGANTLLTPGNSGTLYYAFEVREVIDKNSAILSLNNGRVLISDVDTSKWADGTKQLLKVPLYVKAPSKFRSTTFTELAPIKPTAAEWKAWTADPKKAEKK